MSAIGFRLRSEARSQWAAWLAVALLIGLIGGLTMGLVAGARRTNSVYDRFLARSAPADVLIAESTDFGTTKIDVAAAASLPEVSAQAISTVYFSVMRLADGRLMLPGQDALALVDPGEVGDGLNRASPIEGRLADPDEAMETAIGFHLAQQFDIEIGDSIEITLLPLASQAATQALFFESLQARVDSPEPDLFDWESAIIGPKVNLEVVGITAAPLEFPPFASRIPIVRLTPAFERMAGPDMWTTKYLHARLTPGVTVEQYQQKVEVEASNGNAVVVYAVGALHAASVKQGISVRAVGLLVLAGLFGLAGAVAVAQAVTRLVVASSADASTLRALGWDTRDLVRLAMARMAFISFAGAAFAGAVAVALSPLWPDGTARFAELDQGWRFDPPTILLGALVIVAVTPLLAAWAVRSDSIRNRSNAPRGPAVPMIGTPTVRLGIGFALDPRAAGGRVPVRSSIAATATALSLVTIVLVFQGQSARLVSDAPAYGWNWDSTVGSPGLGNFGEFVVDALADYPGIDGMAIGTVTNVEVNGRRVDALAVDDVAGSVVPTIRAGRAPQRDGEIALGSVALTDIDAGVGDDVDVAVGSLSERFEVVGEVVTPTLGDQGRLGSGAFMTASSLARLVPGLAANVVLVDLGSTADAASVENLRLAFAPIPTRDATNGDELGFTDAAPTDTLVVIAAVIALAIVANIVSMSVRRRHRELAVVRALGLTRAQARHVIHAEAITTAVVALLIGLPLGAAVGRVGWDAFLDTLGVDGPDGLDWQRLGKLAIVIVVLTTIFSLVPARLATNDSPADRLRGR